MALSLVIAEQAWQSTGSLPLAASPGALGAVPELGWIRKVFFSLPLTMLYVMRPEEPPMCIAWMLATAVPGSELNSVKGQQSLGTGGGEHQGGVFSP